LSGIAIIVNGGPDASHRVDAMIDIMKHRGPHARGKFSDNWVTLGHVQLSILDPDSRANQPMFNHDNTLGVVLDGEIYNYKLLKKMLSFYQYRTESNTEVILAAYEKWGTGCLSYFEGVFSFVIYDCKRKLLFGARDHFGVKPLYYTKQSEKLLFASEIKGLLTQLEGVSANHSAIIEYLFTYCAEHRKETFFDGLFQLMPGGAFTLQGEKFKLFRYYDLKNHVKVDNKISQQQADNDFLELLTLCTSESIQSVNNAGVLYSGGLDSSSLLACAIRAPGQYKLQAYTSLSDDTKPAEIEIFKNMLEEFGTAGTFCNTRLDDIEPALRRIMWHLEMPFPSSSMLYDSVCRKALEDNNIILLHGQAGGAVQAGGLAQYSIYLVDLFLQGQWGDFFHGLKSWKTRGKDGPWMQFLRALAHHWEPTWYHQVKVRTHRYLNYFSLDFLKRVEFYKSQKMPFSSEMQNVIYRSMYVSKQPRLLRILDRYSQSHSCEIRMPYMDHRLIEFLFSVPDHFKIQDGIQKLLIRRSMKSLIPEYTFKTPKNTFMQENFSLQDKDRLDQGYKLILGSRAASQRGIYQPKLIQKLVGNGMDNRGIRRRIGQIELWYQTFIDQKP